MISRDWDKITRLIHQCWVSFQLGAGQDYNVEPNDDDLRSIRIGAEFVLANPDAGASAQHDLWMATRIEDGWVYGTEKNRERKTHPDLVPFDQLPAIEQAKDTNFNMACRLAFQLFPPYFVGGLTLRLE